MRENFVDMGLITSVCVFFAVLAARIPQDDPANETAPDQGIVSTATVESVYDGDTITVSVKKTFKVRMLDCWAPEVRTKDKEEKLRGIASKEYLNSLIKKGDRVVVEIPMTENIADSFTFGRILAHVWKDLDGDGSLDNISNEMVDNGFATKEKVKKPKR